MKQKLFEHLKIDNSKDLAKHLVKIGYPSLAKLVKLLDIKL